MIRTWLILTFGDERQYAGNAGYDDELGKWYSYDSFVANHRQVEEGDGVIICDRFRALGIARIDKIDSKPSTRILQRCPVCQKTGIKKRKAMRPHFRCVAGHEFDEPIQQNAPCTAYTAHFGSSFRPFTEHFGREFLRPGCPRYSDQLAMQQFDFVRMQSVFFKTYPKAAEIISLAIKDPFLESEAAEEADQQLNEGGYTPNQSDDRDRILRQIRARRGQRIFRDKLRTRFGEQCVICGCKVLHVLEAAHINPYRGEKDNHVENGLLLRADLHTLFDLNLLGIEPSKLTVHFHPEVDHAEYKALHGKRLLCPIGFSPSVEALTARWKVFEKRLLQSSPLVEAV